MSTTNIASKLNACDCCDTEIQRAVVHNRPGLPALSYRISTHSGFFDRMIARLPQKIIKNVPTLIQLTTRRLDDLSIGLLDAWATLADVITFYQERIANEGFLRTATERRSVLELARSIGYELNPGVAASTYLAFKVEDAEGAPESTTIKKGVKVISVPGQDEKPQTFETTEKIKAYSAWNAMKPQQAEKPLVGRSTTELYLKGTKTQLKPGDALLLVGKHREKVDTGSERWDFRILQEVKEFPKEDYTLVSWKEDLGHETPFTDPADDPKVYTFRKRVSLFGNNAPDWKAMSDDIKKAYDSSNYNASQPSASTWASNWPNFRILTVKDKQINLDANYPEILEDTWVVLVDQTLVELYKVVEIITTAQTDFTLTSKSTRLTLDSNEHLDHFRLRQTVVYAQSEELECAKTPIPEPVFGTEIVLDKVVKNLYEEQTIAVIGKQARYVTVAPRSYIVKVGETEVTRYASSLALTSMDGSSSAGLAAGDVLEIIAPPLPKTDGSIEWHLKDENGFEGLVTTQPGEIIPKAAEADDDIVSEINIIDRISSDEEHTTITLEDPLQYTYDRKSVTFNANVATATHGETIEEVLGSGDGAKTHQRFKLKKSPLTYVSSSTPRGSESTLTVRVDDVAWTEKNSLYNLDASSKDFITHLDDEGNVHVIFGDGRRGVRVPTGVENVKATYRSGIGPEGEVRANSLTIMQTRPFGVREVTNPIEASGSAAPESLDKARDNAPLTVLTFERIVSLKDFEDFARAFSGIGKAKAAVLWDGSQRLVHITVTSDKGGAVSQDSNLYKNLKKAIDNARDPIQAVRIDSYEALSFKCDAALLIDSTYITEKVFENVKNELASAFSFEKRALGQAVTAAEVVSKMQAVDGVIAVDLNSLYIAGTGSVPASVDISAVLVANTAHLDGSTVKPAQLIQLATGGVTLTEMNP